MRVNKFLEFIQLGLDVKKVKDVQRGLTIFGGSGTTQGDARGTIFIYGRGGHYTTIVCFYRRFGSFLTRFQVSVAHELIHGSGLKIVCGHPYGQRALLLTTQGFVQR